MEVYTLTNQISNIIPNTQSTIEQKSDNGNVDTGGVSFVDILNCGTDVDEKEIKNTEIECSLSLISALFTVPTENFDCGIEDDTCNIESTSPNELSNIDVVQVACNDIKEEIKIPEDFNNTYVAKQNPSIDTDTETAVNEQEIIIDELPAPIVKEETLDLGQKQIEYDGLELEDISAKYLNNEKPISDDKRVRKKASLEDDLQPQDNIETKESVVEHLGDTKVLLEEKQEDSSQGEQKTPEQIIHNEDFRINEVSVPEVLSFKGDKFNKIDTFENSQQLVEALENKIVKSVAFAETEDSQEFELHLKPEFLGKLEIKLSKDHEGMKVKITTSNPEVREMLTTRAELLQTQINNKGIELNNVEIIYNSLLGDKSMQERERFKESTKKKNFKSKGAYDQSITLDANVNSIRPDINVNGSVSYLV